MFDQQKTGRSKIRNADAINNDAFLPADAADPV